MKKLSENPFAIYIFTLVILTIILAGLAVLDSQNILLVIGTYLLYGGTFSTIIGFAFLGKGSGNKGGHGQIEYLRNNEYFKKTRLHERPYERFVWAVIFASISVAAIGYFFNEFITGW